MIVDSENRVVQIDRKNNKRNYWYDNCVSAGLFVFSTDILKLIPKPIKLDLELDVLSLLIESKLVYAYKTSEYVKDAGTVERFIQVSRDQSQGMWELKSLSNKQKCVFLDRDGTINKYKGLINKEEDFELEEGVTKAIRMLNKAGYITIVVTNQPVVARGMCSLEDIQRIHKKMQTLLGADKAYIDECVFCPHHPDKGYPEENVLYKVECNCRKPAIGLITKMVKKYNIDLSCSFMVGDTTVDVLTGKNAGIKTILLSTGQAGADGKYNVMPDFRAENLISAVEIILQTQEEKLAVVK